MDRPALVLLVTFCCWPFFQGSGLPQSTTAGVNPLAVSVHATGVRRLEPGKWSVVGVLGENRGDADGEAQVAVYFDNDSRLQYVRRFWVPAGAVRMTWLPVLVPETIPRHQGFSELTALVTEASSGRDVLRRESGEPLTRQTVVKVDHDPLKTGTIFARSSLDPIAGDSQLDNDAYEMVVSSRASADQSRITIDLNADFLPPFPFALEGLDQIVLCGDHVAADSAGLVALRNWLHRGGRLWIMLDRVGEEAVHLLLGHAASFEEVDRVELNEFPIEDVSPLEGARTSENCSFESPVQFVRVLTDSADVHCRVNGWPAAFWQPVGDGEVLFTTLSARGWLRRRNELDRYDYRKYTRVNLIPTDALSSLASRFYQPRETKLLPPGELGPLLHGQIGYTIPSRKAAAMVLGLNCVGLLGVGAWLARRRRLDRLAWAVPAITLTATAVLLALGSINAQSVAPTVAVTQIVRTATETDDVHISGAAAVYHQVTNDFSVGSVQGGLALPDMREFSGVTKRLVWDDHGGCRWRNLELPSGSVRLVALEKSGTVSAPLVGRGEFGPNGFVGKISGDLPEDVSDALIAAPPGPRIAVSVEKDGSFRSGDQVLASEQYLASSLLTDEQVRRQAVYRRMLDPSGAAWSSNRPTLFLWSRLLDSGFLFPQDCRLTGAALTVIPLQINHAPPGTKFRIPPPFMRIESVRGPSGTSSAFNPRTGHWTPRLTMPSRAYLRFVLPEQVLPCRLDGAVLTVKVNAPSRTLEVSRREEDRYVVFWRVHNPSGVPEFPIDPKDLPPLDPGGGLLLAIAVTQTNSELQMRQNKDSLSRQGRAAGFSPAGGTDRQRSGGTTFSNDTWQIDYVRLEVTGETL